MTLHSRRVTSATGSEVTAGIRIRGLSKRFGREIVAVERFDLDVADGEVVVILGPSGCGKTTILRSVAGLETPDTGEIEINGELIFSAERGINLPPERRGLGMVFQSYAIWPHMKVGANVGYPLKMRRVAKRQLDAEVERLLATVGLEGMAERLATELSGGQQQRVALARALIAHPRAILFDEPLSNLDAKLRERMRLELRRLRVNSPYTGLYVTHDQVEAMALADRVVVMRSGKIEQQGPPEEVHGRPASRFVADFMGNTNALPATVREVQGEDIMVDSPLGIVRGSSSSTAWIIGDKATLLLRPTALQICEGDQPGVKARLVTSIFMGESSLFEVDVDGVSVSIQDRHSLHLQPGQGVVVGLRPHAFAWLLRD